MSAKSPPFLMWYDDNPKLSVAHKIEEAMAAYADRLGVRPTLVLVNEAELTELPGIAVRSMATVRRNTFWVGQEERPGATSVEVERIPSRSAAKAARAATTTRAAPRPAVSAAAKAPPAPEAPPTPRRRVKATA
ncbi:MAG TPA: hypothetical protein PKD53_18220 [Chloroflexaceae bacterium]|nr:hypothetical protein [Chloroflexaceae bacterium]